MKIVFMGTPEFAIPSLQAIIESEHELVAVVTVPDKPVGRGLKIKASPVKQIALDYNIPVLQPERLKDNSFAEQLKAYNADLFVVVAFRILPEMIFTIPPFGTINLHASLLPNYRGAAPINWAIIRGETETGVTIFYIQKKVDTGNIILQEKEKILPDDNAGDLHDKLMNLGAELLGETIDLIAANEAPVTVQTGDFTSAPKISKEFCQIQWNNSTCLIHNLIRGLSPTPGAFSHVNGKLLKIFTSRIISQNIVPTEEPGTIVELNHKTGTIAISTGDGILAIEEIQLAGKRSMCAAEYLKGCRLNIGDKLV